MVIQEQIRAVLLKAPSFDPTDCEVTVSDGGGNTFECYDLGTYSSGNLPTAGTGIASVSIGNSPIRFAFGETFEDYSVTTNFVDGPIGASVTGFSSYYVAISTVRVLFGEDFEDYSVTATWTEGTIGANVTGFSTYYLGAGP